MFTRASSCRTSSRLGASITPLRAPPAAIGKAAAPPPTLRLVTISGALAAREERSRRPDVGSDNMRRAKVPLIDQPSQEVARGVGRYQLVGQVGVAESRHIEGQHSANLGDLSPDAAKRPKALRPRRQHEDDRVGFRLGVGVPNSRSVAYPKVGRNFRCSLITHVVSILGRWPDRWQSA